MRALVASLLTLSCTIAHAEDKAAPHSAALPPLMTGKWQTNSGQFYGDHELQIKAIDGTAVKGVLRVWSQSCPGRPSEFTGTYDGTTLNFATAANSLCLPVKYVLKASDKNRLEGPWEAGEYRGTGYFNPK